MAHPLVVALSMILAAPPGSAADPKRVPGATAPAGGPNVRYCLRVDPLTGSIIARVHCWTREEWDEQGVDVDKQWDRDGIRVEE